MFRCYQRGDFGEWVTSTDKDPHNLWNFARQHEASRITTLALNSDPEIAGPESMTYQGPLFFDIDHTDLSVALESGVQLCKKLTSIGVEEDDLEIHLSGAKGIHVFINMNIFSTGKPEKNLPDLYRMLALKLYVTGLDQQVYSNGRGRMVRPPDSLRPDKKYKVIVTFEELQALTVDGYREMVQSPRGQETFSGPNTKSQVLANLFDQVKKEYKEHTKIESKFKTAKAVTDISIFGGSVPACVSALMDGKRGSAASFNQIAYNVGCWSARADVPKDQLESVHARIVDACPSRKGVSSQKRKTLLLAFHGYATGNLDKNKFICGSILNTISVKPCEGCPVKAMVATTQSLETLLLFEHSGQWYTDQDHTHVVSTFTMERESIIMDELTGKYLASTVSLAIPSRASTHTIKDFDESAWTSKSQFKKEISGIDGAAFVGTDDDVTRIRHTISLGELQASSEINIVIAASSVGIHYRKRTGPEDVMSPGHSGRLTYIEPGFSVNNVGVYDTLLFKGNESVVAPRLSQKDWYNPISAEANHAFSLLLKCNTVETISPVLGWFLAAHLKTHIYQVSKRFPLLCISGVAGTGKNALTGVLMRLSGLEGEAALSTLEAPNSTKLPFQQGVSESTTIPRIINELNPKSCTTQKHYTDIIEILKGAFDSQVISKGRLGGGDRNGANVSTVSWRISAPICTLSEEMVDVPAIHHRAIMVNMTAAGHDYGFDVFTELEPKADALAEFAPKLVHGALQTPVKAIGEMLQRAKMPVSMDVRDINERLRFGYKCILVAYDWATSVLGSQESGFSAENYNALCQMREKFYDYMESSSAQIAKSSSVTEVDKVVRDFAVMALYSGKDNVQWGIDKGIHFVAEDGVLYIDTMMTWPMLSRYKSGSSDPLKIKTEQAFLNAVKGMSYFISDTALSRLLPTAGRTILALDINILQEKSIPVQAFL